jgi:hypothetical protein
MLRCNWNWNIIPNGRNAIEGERFEPSSAFAAASTALEGAIASTTSMASTAISATRVATTTSHREHGTDERR